MGTAGWIILVVVVVVVVGAAAYALMGNKRSSVRREQAEQLRGEATRNTAAVEAARREAEEAEARAEVARAEAERADQEATRARQGAAFEEASVEDRIREADRLDPDVDTRADDYRPGEPTTAPETGGGTTYADPDDRTATEAGARRPLDEPDVDPEEPVHRHTHQHRNLPD
jgi:hypothetical protein